MFHYFDFVGVDLVGVDLLGVDLLGVDLVGIDLLGVDLVGVDLVGPTQNSPPPLNNKIKRFLRSSKTKFSFQKKEYIVIL